MEKDAKNLLCQQELAQVNPGKGEPAF